MFKNLISKDRGFYKTVAKIAIPIALQGLITTGVNMMDTIMVGAVGETELSAPDEEPKSSEEASISRPEDTTENGI